MIKFRIKCDKNTFPLFMGYADAFRTVYNLCLDYTKSYYKEHHKRPGVPNQVKFLNQGTTSAWLHQIPNDIVMQAIIAVRDDFRSVDRGFKKSVEPIGCRGAAFFKLSSVNCYNNCVKIGSRRVYIDNPTHFEGLVKNATVKLIDSHWVLSGTLQFRKRVSANGKKTAHRG